MIENNNSNPDKSILDYVSEVIKKYNEITSDISEECCIPIFRKIDNFLNPNRFSKKLINSKIQIAKVIKNSTKDLMPNNSTSLRGGETFYVGDVHGGLGAICKTLYAGGLIDKDGNWKGGSKKLVQLGDLLHRGPHSLETMVYINSLKKQAFDIGGLVEVLAGNHEMVYITQPKDVLNSYSAFDDFARGSHYEFYRKIISNDIKEGNLKCAYVDKSNNIIATHAGIRKNVLVDFLKAHKVKFNMQYLKFYEEKRYSINSSDFNKIMKENNLSLEDLADYINREMVIFEKNNSDNIYYFDSDKEIPYNIFDYYKYSPIETREKAENHSIKPSSINVNKMIQIVGHTPVISESLKTNPRAVYNNPFSRVGNTIYIDTAMFLENTSKDSELNLKNNQENGMLFIGKGLNNKIYAEILHRQGNESRVKNMDEVSKAINKHHQDIDKEKKSAKLSDALIKSSFIKKNTPIKILLNKEKRRNSITRSITI